MCKDIVCCLVSRCIAVLSSFALRQSCEERVLITVAFPISGPHAAELCRQLAHFRAAFYLARGKGLTDTCSFRQGLFPLSSRWRRDIVTTKVRRRYWRGRGCRLVSLNRPSRQLRKRKARTNKIPNKRFCCLGVYSYQPFQVGFEQKLIVERVEKWDNLGANRFVVCMQRPELSETLCVRCWHLRLTNTYERDQLVYPDRG